MNQVQELLTNQQNAQTAVNDGQLKPTVSQSGIDQAQQLVDKLPDGEKKQELQAQLDKAKELFTQQQNALKEAQRLVDKVADENKKQELQKKLASKTISRSNRYGKWLVYRC